MNKKKETKRIKCKYCGYEWNTRSKHVKVSCPSCLNKVDNKEAEEE